jgi:hypothetical protein
MQQDLHVDYAAGDVHEIFLPVEERAGNNRKKQKCNNNYSCEKLLYLETLQILIESSREMLDQESI